MRLLFALLFISQILFASDTVDKFKDAFDSLIKDVKTKTKELSQSDEADKVVQEAKNLYSKAKANPKVQKGIETSKEGWNKILSKGCESLNNTLKADCLKGKID